MIDYLIVLIIDIKFVDFRMEESTNETLTDWKKRMKETKLVGLEDEIKDLFKENSSEKAQSWFDRNPDTARIESLTRTRWEEEYKKADLFSGYVDTGWEKQDVDSATEVEGNDEGNGDFTEYRESCFCPYEFQTGNDVHKKKRDGLQKFLEALDESSMERKKFPLVCYQQSGETVGPSLLCHAVFGGKVVVSDVRGVLEGKKMTFKHCVKDATAKLNKILGVYGMEGKFITTGSKGGRTAASKTKDLPVPHFRVMESTNISSAFRSEKFNRDTMRILTCERKTKPYPLYCARCLDQEGGRGQKIGTAWVYKCYESREQIDDLNPFLVVDMVELFPHDKCIGEENVNPRKQTDLETVNNKGYCLMEFPHSDIVGNVLEGVEMLADKWKAGNKMIPSSQVYYDLEGSSESIVMHNAVWAPVKFWRQLFLKPSELLFMQVRFYLWIIIRNRCVDECTKLQKMNKYPEVEEEDIEMPHLRTGRWSFVHAGWKRDTAVKTVAELPFHCMRLEEAKHMINSATCTGSCDQKRHADIPPVGKVRVRDNKYLMKKMKPGSMEFVVSKEDDNQRKIRYFYKEYDEEKFDDVALMHNTLLQWQGCVDHLGLSTKEGRVKLKTAVFCGFDSIYHSSRYDTLDLSQDVSGYHLAGEEDREHLFGHAMKLSNELIDQVIEKKPVLMKKEIEMWSNFVDKAGKALAVLKEHKEGEVLNEEKKESSKKRKSKKSAGKRKRSKIAIENTELSDDNEELPDSVAGVGGNDTAVNEEKTDEREDGGDKELEESEVESEGKKGKVSN